MIIAFPELAKELIELFQADQKEYKAFSGKYYWGTDSQSDMAVEAKVTFKKHVHARAMRMLEILEEVKEPTLSNVGQEAAQAISILATHSSLGTTRKVLTAFESCYKQNRNNTYYQAIPAMADWVLLLSRKPQRFGTIWLFAKNKQPYLPTVEDYENINERRAEYGLEPLRWPKSLAIPESEQPWLKQPLSQLVMREPSNKEYEEFAADFL